MRINLETNNSVISTNSINSNLSQECNIKSNQEKTKIQETPRTCC